MKVEGFEKRVVYNTSKAYVMPLRGTQEYPALCNVIGVTLCNFNLWPDKDPAGRDKVQGNPTRVDLLVGNPTRVDLMLCQHPAKTGANDLPDLSPNGYSPAERQ